MNNETLVFASKSIGKILVVCILIKDSKEQKFWKMLDCYFLRIADNETAQIKMILNHYFSTLPKYCY